MSNILDLLNNQFTQRVITTLLVAAIGWIGKWLRIRYLKSKYHFILGDWIGNYLTSNNDWMKQQISIYPKVFGKLKIKIIEQTNENYIYRGRVDVVEDNVFAYLNGENHPGKSFISIKIPFNRKNSIPTLNGIFSGVNQENKPVSVKVVWSRFDLSLNDLKLKLGNKKRYIKVPDTD